MRCELRVAGCGLKSSEPLKPPPSPFPLPSSLLVLLLLLGLGTGCGVFDPREPEAPIDEAGTYVQPDAPDLVVDNLRNAVAELNTQNYRRSLDEQLTFEPTAAAQARSPSLWGSWGRSEEVSYFTTLTEAARLNQGHELRLNDVIEEVGADRYVLEATYLLVVRHRRPDAPDSVQGRLVWDIRPDADGLWRLRRWTDQELGNTPSWSDLKAEFVQ
jgi:hypothetical protein